VNTWRRANKQEPLTMPEGPSVEPVTAQKLEPLLAAWLAADEGDDRDDAEAALCELGLGSLPVLKKKRAAANDDETKGRIDGLVRRVACIVRAIHWSEDGPRPNAAMRELVEGLAGKPIRGSDLTNLFRQCWVDETDGTTGIDFTLSRSGDDTGYEMTISMTTHRVSWRGGEGGFILSGDGRGLVDTHWLEDRSSWWHKSRSEQLDEELLRREDQEVRIRRAFVRVK